MSHVCTATMSKVGVRVVVTVPWHSFSSFPEMECHGSPMVEMF